ncbi:MAG TPA: hypothetical protein VHF02_03075 [Luteimonas sp.]|nr:hypothetical protein [Luteimonas sp.]
MSLRGWSALALLLAAIGWWYSPLSPRVGHAPLPADGVTIRCRLPPRVLAGDAPLQSDAPPSLQAFRLRATTLLPLAGFSIDARVLSREDYSHGRESELSPTDLVLGWGRMATPGLAERLDVSQSSRWYHYQWSGEPPLPPAEIARSSANMHLIPADAAVAAALKNVQAGERVRIDGWLVEADAPDGWRWRSSTTREDIGAGACELIYICAITRF